MNDIGWTAPWITIFVLGEYFHVNKLYTKCRYTTFEHECSLSVWLFKTVLTAGTEHNALCIVKCFVHVVQCIVVL